MLKQFSSRFAHEVYVLSPKEVQVDHGNHSIHVFNVLNNSHNLHLALFYTLFIGAVLGVALCLKSTSPFKRLGLLIDKTTVVAPDLIRVAFGTSLIFSGIHNALFGPELQLSTFPLSSLVRIALIVMGVFLILGFRTRMFGAITIILWLGAFVTKGWYLLTYTNYLGEGIAVVLLPCQRFSLDSLLGHYKKPQANLASSLSMPVARILFGFSLLFTAINVKLLSPALSLDVVNRYHLTRYFPFSPLFVVFGAAMVEILVALLYMAGLLRRLNTIVFLVFITLSISFFKESVWPHYLLLAFGVGIFLHQPDMLALDRYIFAPSNKKKDA